MIIVKIPISFQILPAYDDSVIFYLLQHFNNVGTVVINCREWDGWTRWYIEESSSLAAPPLFSPYWHLPLRLWQAYNFFLPGWLQGLWQLQTEMLAFFPIGFFFSDITSRGHLGSLVKSASWSLLQSWSTLKRSMVTPAAWCVKCSSDSVWGCWWTVPTDLWRRNYSPQQQLESWQA
jgi:hypothetical protein